MKRFDALPPAWGYLNQALNRIAGKKVIQCMSACVWMTFFADARTFLILSSIYCKKCGITIFYKYVHNR